MDVENSSWWLVVTGKECGKRPSRDMAITQAKDWQGPAVVNHNSRVGG